VPQTLPGRPPGKGRPCVYLVKHCPDCGATEALVSSDASAGSGKRDICQNTTPPQPLTCSLQCKTCKHQHNPRMVFLDVTNRCNMKLPRSASPTSRAWASSSIRPSATSSACSRPSASANPKPSAINLFGGEPTLRDDLFDIIELTKRNGLSPRVVNQRPAPGGRGLLAAGSARPAPRSSSPSTVATPPSTSGLRKSPGAYQKKLKALENLGKYGQPQDHPDVLRSPRRQRQAHARPDRLLPREPLVYQVHAPDPADGDVGGGEFETDMATTTEDVEQIVADAFPEGKVEFLPMGRRRWLARTCDFFGTVPLKFGGVHRTARPATYLLSDGTRYRPLQ